MSVRAGRKSRATSLRRARSSEPHARPKREMRNDERDQCEFPLDDERWMREALSEAARGLGRTSPNPAVGCVIVKGGREVARGFYAGSAGPHAEAVALAAAGTRAKGATAYVTLEPHAHQSRTPPCTDALIAARIARVVIGCMDPNELVRGRGVRQLHDAGIDVACGLFERECSEMIRGFRSVITGQGPFVHLKLAATLDGRIAAQGGDSKWISGEQSRALVQHMRARSEAVLVGIGTVLADDPRLTCRIAGAASPLRVVLDPELRTPARAKVVSGRGKVLVVGSPRASAARRRRLENAGAEVAALDSRGPGGWRRLLALLEARGVMELLVEGGGAVAASALKARVVDRVSIFYNPRFIGGDGVAMITGLGTRRAADGLRLRTLAFGPVGDDLLWEGEPALRPKAEPARPSKEKERGTKRERSK